MFKKNLSLFLILIVAFMPLCVFAEDEVSTEDKNIVIPTVEEKNADVEFAGCTIVSGNGKDIGSEVACGTEHFYVISNDGENVRMLAKYNLMVGYVYDVIEVDQTFDNQTDAFRYLRDNNYVGENVWIWLYLYDENDRIYGATVYSELEYDKVMQDPLAVGAHGGESGKPSFPEVAVLFGNVSDALDSLSNPTPYGGGGYIDFDYVGDTEERAYFLEYQNVLSEIGVEVIDITSLAISDIDDIVYKLTNSRLPLEDWWYSWQEISDDFRDSYYIVGDLKEYLPDGYEWLYSTTYWTRTVENHQEYQYFVDTLGNVCNGNACSIAVGAGLRPVVTTASSNLIYNIMTKTDGNGTVTASKVTSESGQEIEFTVTPREGYTLKRVIVRTASGEVLEFNEYKFRMPSENVEIYAEFERIGNPSTGFVFPFVVILVSVLCGVVVYLSQREVKNSN